MPQMDEERRHRTGDGEAESDAGKDVRNHGGVGTWTSKRGTADKAGAYANPVDATSVGGRADATEESRTLTPSAMRSVTVYCSSSTALEPHFAKAARLVGEELARRKLVLVYGGGSIGLMGEAARAAKAAGGHVVGIITKQLLDLEQGWTGCDEMVVVESMRDRKKLLEERGDAFLVLPGGLGTYEEFFEILVGRYLQNHAKPIGVVNDHGYYDPMIALIDHGIEHKFIRPAVKELVRIAPDPIAVIEFLLSAQSHTVSLNDCLPMGGARGIHR
jgi:uncharacterized protein (TIGR00730 family)